MNEKVKMSKIDCLNVIKNKEKVCISKEKKSN